MREYKEDSTRGKSMIRPRRYKRDALVQTWVDRRKLAMLSIWLDEGGYGTRFLSDVVKITIDEIVEKLVREGMVRRVEFTDEATRILQSKYKIDLNPSGRGVKNLVHNLTLDDLRRERSKVAGVGESIDDLVSKMSIEEEKKMREEAERAAEIYRKLEEEEERKKQERRIAENYKVVDGVVVPRDSSDRGPQPRSGSPTTSSNVTNSKIRSKSEEEVAREIERIREEDAKLAEMNLTSEVADASGVVEVDD